MLWIQLLFKKNIKISIQYMNPFPSSILTCLQWLRKWIKKCDDDSETSNWIAANTKVWILSFFFFSHLVLCYVLSLNKITQC